MAVFVLGANPALRCNLFFGEKPQKRISTAIGAKKQRNEKNNLFYIHIIISKL
jgi:hypothetical protein